MMREVRTLTTPCAIQQGELSFGAGATIVVLDPYGAESVEVLLEVTSVHDPGFAYKKVSATNSSCLPEEGGAILFPPNQKGIVLFRVPTSDNPAHPFRILRVNSPSRQVRTPG